MLKMVKVKVNEEWEQADNEDYQALSVEAFEKSAVKAQEDGFEVIVRREHQLLLDLDTPESIDNYIPFIIEYLPRYGLVDWEEWESKSGNKHVLVNLDREISPEVAIALQVICGSDPVREFLNLLKIENGIEEPTRLFKPKQEVSSEDRDSE